jgi:hypothetical protein
MALIVKIASAFLGSKSGLELVLKVLEVLFVKRPELKEQFIRFYVDWEKRTPEALSFRSQYHAAQAALDDMEKARKAAAEAGAP